ncbi:MAG: hypothetical protein ABF536_06345 [Liquorilactobacillus mali]|uniref:hypothetical protein n=1 Tax=Liquorilactobacillus mali TaxID=1618 RepID=UPI0039E7F8DC
MADKKDYGKLNEELLGILAGKLGEDNTLEEYITQTVADKLAYKAPEILNRTKQMYRLVADNPNQLVGKLTRLLIDNAEFIETPNGDWKVDVPIWKFKNDKSI